MIRKTRAENKTNPVAMAIGYTENGVVSMGEFPAQK